MRIVFADTGYGVALLNPQDDLHAIAVNLSKILYPVHIITSEVVPTELSVTVVFGVVVIAA